ncbi:MAG: hypothetical protein K6E98_10310, partial [Lachnospiraceae bacterium]|nr:hypothetical protein [Lachnospiraceae bacterium]
MDSKEIIALLNQEPEMNPDLHDGSYELMREIVESYSHVEDYSVLNYKDLNAVYAMAIGTWKLNVEKKKEYVYAGHLPDDEKETMADVIDTVWDHACRGKYTNREGKGPSIGMFGTGFYSFENKADAKSCQRFIKMLVDIASLDDDNQIFDVCSKVFDSDFNGMQAASASVMLHCMKPFTFPILNANFGDGTVYEPLGITLVKPRRLSSFIDNCRRIKAFRDANLTIKNYRILDCFPRNHNLSETSEWFPALDKYDPGITAEQYHDLFLNEKIVKRNWLGALYELYQMPNYMGTCKQLGDKYGYAPSHYISYLTSAAENIANETRCELLPREEENSRYWPVLFQGKHTNDRSQGAYLWKMREPVIEAIEMLMDEGVLDLEEKTEMTKTSLNTILYGPPGTGKTFNTVLYAVAIVEKKSIQEVQQEAVSDYKSVKERFEEYKNQGRIAFTTFHQSYG